jgi:hypothetical protein
MKFEPGFGGNPVRARVVITVEIDPGQAAVAVPGLVVYASWMGPNAGRLFMVTAAPMSFGTLKDRFQQRGMPAPARGV